MTIITSRFRIEQVGLIVIILLGLALRLADSSYSFGVDEVFSVKLARHHLNEVLLLSLNDRPHPPLYYLLLHFWIYMFGSSETAVRSLSVLFSCGFLLVSYYMLRRFLDRWLALGMVALLAVSPFFVFYGYEARPYALIAFLSAVNLKAFLAILEAPWQRRRLIVWALTCALILYSQYLAILTISIQIGLAYLYLPEQRIAILAWGAAGSALILPWFVFAMGGMLVDGSDPLPQISWIGRPTLLDLAWFFISLFGEAPAFSARVLIAIAFVLGVCYLRSRIKARSLPADHAAVLLIGVSLPVLLWLVSVWGPKPVFAGRQLIGAGFAIVIATGLCLASMARGPALAALVTLLAWSAACLPQALPRNQFPPYQEMASRIDADYGFVLVTAEESWVLDPLAYYIRTGRVQFWDRLTELERSDPMLLVCRPFRCAEFEADALQPRRSLLATWEWGVPGNSPEHHQLRLYELRGLSGR